MIYLLVFPPVCFLVMMWSWHRSGNRITVPEVGSMVATSIFPVVNVMVMIAMLYNSIYTTKGKE